MMISTTIIYIYIIYTLRNTYIIYTYLDTIYIYICIHICIIYIYVCFVYNMIPASHRFWSCLVVPPASAVKRPFTKRCLCKGFRPSKASKTGCGCLDYSLTYVGFHQCDIYIYIYVCMVYMVNTTHLAMVYTNYVC